ncbi:MAG: hypothetical protein OXF22_04510 [Anaerolineaceae bacterium]|nr:hypothetical protein [Anaerolineaceae bacterium]
MRLRIQGGTPLMGEYRPAGNTNAAVALLAGSLLSQSTVQLQNLPPTTHTFAMLETASGLGCHIQWHSDDGAMMAEIRGGHWSSQTLPRYASERYAGTLLFLAPLLCSHERVCIELDLPLRRIRTHLAALRKLGLVEEAAGGQIWLRRRHWAEHSLILNEPSVTGTALLLMLAAQLGEKTTLENAACEPHIQELGRLLGQMGTEIEGLGTNRLVIWGKRALGGARATVGPDHIEAGSVAAIAALSGGEVQMPLVRSADMRMIAQVFAQLGLQMHLADEELIVPRQESPAASLREEDIDTEIETSTWPGFPSDLVAIATVIATQLPRSTLIHERLYDNHLFFVDRLNAMGAQIVLCDPHRALVVGAQALHGVYLDSPDIRAGLGMVAAALIAQGETVMDNAQVIEQQFAGTLDQLVSLGADIERE